MKDLYNLSISVGMVMKCGLNPAIHLGVDPSKSKATAAASKAVGSPPANTSGRANKFQKWKNANRGRAQPQGQSAGGDSKPKPGTTTGESVKDKGASGEKPNKRQAFFGKGRYDKAKKAKVEVCSVCAACDNIQSQRSNDASTSCSVVFNRRVEGRALLDSGSSVNLLSREFADRLIEAGAKVLKSQLSVCSAFGQCSNATGSVFCNLTLSLNGVSTSFPFTADILDVDLPCDVIVGIDAIRTFALVHIFRELFVSERALRRLRNDLHDRASKACALYRAHCNAIFSKVATFGPTEDPAEEDPFEGKTPLSELAVDEPPQEVSDEALRAMVAGDSPFHLRIFDVCRRKRRAFARTVRKEAARVAAMTFNVSAEKWKVLANKIPPRRQTPERQEEVARQVAKLVELGVVVACDVEHASPVLVVAKPGGRGWRLCVDYRRLNAIMESLGWPLPIIKEMLGRVIQAGARYFGVIDLVAGYHQIPLDESCRNFAAFRTHEGTYVPLRVPFGIKVAAQYFQKVMTHVIFKGLVGKIMEIYIDDLLIYGATEEEFLQNLETVLERAEQYGIYFSPDKCKLGSVRAEVVGHVLSNEGYTMSDAKKFKVVDFPLPTTVKRIQSFLGLTNYFRDFIQGYEKLSHPIYELLRGAKKNRRVAWNPEATRAFGAIKEAIQSCPELYHPTERGVLILETDASDYGIGAVLFQLVDLNKRFIGFFSKSLNKVQRRWSTIEKEAYAIFLAFKHFELYLAGRKFTVRTDHRNLQYMNNASPKVLRWKLSIQEFDFDIEHIDGVKNSCADAFSRLVEGESEPIEDSPRVNAIIPVLELSDDQWRMIESVHNLYIGHVGVDKTMWRLQKRGLLKQLPNPRACVRKFVRECPYCQKMGPLKLAINSRRFTLFTYAPMLRVSMDTVGPFPEASGYAHVLVIIDCFSRFVELYPVKSTTAEEAAITLLWHVGRYGCPEQIQSDRGPQFVNNVIQAFKANIGADTALSLAYSHQENGLVERANREVLRHLRLILQEKNVRENWYINLPLVMRIMNSTVHESIGITPAQVLFGNALDLDRCVFMEHLIDPNPRTNDSVIQQFQSVVDRMLAGQAEVIAAAEKHLRKKDEEHLAKDDDNEIVSFSPGLYILINREEAGRGSKLHLSWKGPFKVIEAKNDNHYLVQNLVTGKHFVEHVAKMKAFHYDPRHTSPKAVACKDEGEWLVEAILDHAGDVSKKSSLDFLVKWSGLDDSYNRWLPWKELRRNPILHRYLSSRGLGRWIPKGLQREED